jgi:hypothetical protein
VSRSPSPEQARRAIEEAAAEARTPDFWTARKGLELLHGWARARRVAPWAMLGEALALVLCRTPPAVRLPALVGGPGSLNSLFALTGPSGQGKGAAGQAIRDALDVWQQVEIVPIGSGEGLAKTYGRGLRDKDTGQYEVQRIRYSALLTVREIDTLGALRERSASTLTPQVRQLYSGEELGFGYADPDKRVIIPAHSYRGCLVAGVQPGRGAVLLGDADAGTPQRFVWLSATDPDAPDSAPDCPSGIAWELPPEIGPIGDGDPHPHVLEVCGVARQVIDSARLARLRGQGDALDGHALFTRLKIAAALALFNGQADVGEEDWQLAGVVMGVSDRTRELVADELRKAAQRENEARGQSEATRARIVRRSTEADSVTRTTQRILKVLGRSKDWVTHSDLRRACGPGYRDYFDDAIETLGEGKRIEVRDIERHSGGFGGTGVQYRSTPRSQPG